MVGRFFTIPGLAEQPTAATDDAVAADHPAARNAERLCLRKALRNFRRAGQSELQLGLVDIRSRRVIRNPSGIEYLPPDRAGRGKDQGQSNNVVENRRGKATARLGRGSTGDLRSAPQPPFNDSSTGTISILSL